MPIYAYRCSTCGHAKDVLQKMSDPVLSVCPACGASTFMKQVTAAGFQLKGSGWYVTDFRGGDNKAGAKPAEGSESAAAGQGESSSGEGGAADAKDKAASSGQGDAASSPAPAATPAAAPAPSSAAPAKPASSKPDSK